jgi:anti-sigma regulatory factor (Ser/Thr protein kinase)
MGQERAASAERTTQRFELSVPPVLSALADVRRSFDAFGLPRNVRDDAQLLVTELLSNSIRHAALRADERIRIWAGWSGRRLKVIVRDHDPAPSGQQGRDVRIAGSIRPAPGAESGWGLFIVDQLATRWGTIQDGPRGYWFELDLDPSPEARERN